MNLYKMKSGAIVFVAAATMVWSFNQISNDTPTQRQILSTPTVYAQQTTVKQEKVSPASIYLNGEQLQLDQQSLLINGSTLVPLRGVFDEMGIEVKWSSETKQVHVKDKDITVQLTPGVDTVKVNGKSTTLSSASVIQNGTTYVPLRFISETFGYIVGYDKASKSISISTKPYEQMKVVYVVDGDTIDAVPISKLHKNGSYDKEDKIRIRMIGVNTPESTKEAGIEAGGPEASAYTKSKLTDKTVNITLDKTNDPYGRTLAYIHLNSGEFFNATLVSEGYAKVMTIAPNTQWANYFTDLETIAKTNKSNLWNPALYANVSDDVSNLLIENASVAGLSLTKADLGSSISKTEASSLLLYLLYPDTRELMAGYKVYQIATDPNTKEIVTQLYNVTQSKEGTIATGEQLRSLVLTALGLKEDNAIVRTLDNLGLLPSIERELTVGEMIAMVEKLQVFLPTLQELKNSAEKLESGISKLYHSATDKTVNDVLSSLNDKVNGIGEDLSKTTSWIKNTITSWFTKKLSDEEVNEVVEETEKAASDIQQKVEEGAYGLLD